MQPKIHRHVLCSNNVIKQYFKNIKPGDCFAPPPSDFTSGGKTTPLFYIRRSTVITLLVHKTCLYKFLVRLHGEYNILVKLCGNTT